MRAVLVIFMISAFAMLPAARAGASPYSSDTSETAPEPAVPADSLKKGSNDLTDTVFYQSDAVDYDNEARVLQLFGRARIKYQNITLQADTIIYTVGNSQFQARGKPQLVEGSDTTVGDIMVYNIKTRRGRVGYATARFDDTYFTGSKVVKTDDNCLYIEHADYTTCENINHPHYYFYGKHVKVAPEDKAVGRPVVLNVGDAPVAVLPFFVMPLHRGKRSGWLTPGWGGSVANGGYVDNLGYYYAPNDYFDVLAAVKVQEFNNFVFSAKGRYALRYTLDGEVSGRYAVDERLEKSTQQWALDYKHSQLLAPDGRTTLKGAGSILSNRSFNQLYSDETNVLEQQQLDANMALSHKFEGINASSNVIWRRNHNLVTDRVQEDLPSLDFNLHNRAFLPFRADGLSEPSWYNNIYYSYSARANMRRDIYGNDSLPGFTRPGMENSANISSSQKVFKYFDISPYFRVNASMFLGAIKTDTLYKTDTLVYKVKDPSKDTKAPNYTLIKSEREIFINDQGRLDTLYTLTKVGPPQRVFVRDTLDNEFNLVRSWSTGVNLSTRIYGLFPVGLFGITAVRHTLNPTVGYAYVPKHELNRSFYDVRIGYDRPRERAQQLMTMSLSNTFQGKRAAGVEKGGKDAGDGSDKSGESAGVKEEKFDILTASVSTSYNFEAESNRLNDLSVSASTGFSILRVGHSSGFWMYGADSALSVPIAKNYNIDITSGSLGASGSFWDGDFLTLETDLRGAPKSEPGGAGKDWELSFTPGFSYRASRAARDERFKPVKSFNLSGVAGMSLTRDLTVRWNGNYDFSSNQFSHNNYTFHYDLECWEMHFTWRPEKINPGFHFVVNVKKIPDIKWEQREVR